MNIDGLHQRKRKQNKTKNKQNKTKQKQTNNGTAIQAAQLWVEQYRIKKLEHTDIYSSLIMGVPVLDQ